MRFGRVRSGLTETVEDASAVALDTTGHVLFESGEPDTPVFYRSAVKPFQALAASRTGLSLPDEHLAVTCASHGGFPVHLGIVDAILSDHGMTTDALLCTPDRPLSPAAHDLQLARGNSRKERRFHNCSGKHAGWLAACTVAGWDTRSYLDADHRLQQSIIDVVSDVTRLDTEPVGIDGCGAPTLRGSTRGLAHAFQRLDSDPELAPMKHAMARFPALVADNTRPDGRTGMWWGGAQKAGAEGLYGLTRNGVTIAVKAHSGNSSVAVAAALVTADRIGMLTPAMAEALSDELRPRVIGGGETVGHMELIEA